MNLHARSIQSLIMGPHGAEGAWARMKGLVPEVVKQNARTRVVAFDRRSRSHLRQLLSLTPEEYGAQRDDLPAAPGMAETVEIKIRALGGRSLAVRPGTTDAAVLLGTFAGLFQLPPRELQDRDMRFIIDVGSNIGSTIAQLAVAFPQAQIVGVEPNPANTPLCRRNIAPWHDRCELVEAAIWSSDGPVLVRVETGHEDGLQVSATEATPMPGEHTVPGLTLNTLLARLGNPNVDYMKMDIEGAEREVLRHTTEWASCVNSIKVEVHQPYSVDECQADLRALGFVTDVDQRHFACVSGVRPPSASTIRRQPNQP